MSDRRWDYDEEEEAKELPTRFTEFDCSECDANNPYDDGFGEGDEVRCYYCGELWVVHINDMGRLKLRRR